MMDFAMMNAIFPIMIMMVGIGVILAYCIIAPNAFATKAAQRKVSPKGAWRVGPMMDFVMMTAIFLNLIMMVGIVV